MKQGPRSLSIAEIQGDTAYKSVKRQTTLVLGLNRWGGCRPLPYPQAASVRCLSCSTFSGGRSMKDMIIGVDLAKRIFQVHGANASGDSVNPKRISREQFRAFLTSLPASLVVFEACGSARYWAREAQSFGHEARLIAPQYVRPFVPSSKGRRTMPLMLRRSSLPHASRRCALSRLRSSSREATILPLYVERRWFMREHNFWTPYGPTSTNMASCFLSA